MNKKIALILSIICSLVVIGCLIECLISPNENIMLGVVGILFVVFLKYSLDAYEK